MLLTWGCQATVRPDTLLPGGPSLYKLYSTVQLVSVTGVGGSAGISGGLGKDLALSGFSLAGQALPWSLGDRKDWALSALQESTVE